MIITSAIVEALVNAGLDGPLLVSACRNLESVESGFAAQPRESASDMNEADSIGPVDRDKDERGGLSEAATSAPMKSGSSLKAIARHGVVMVRGLRPCARRVLGWLIERHNMDSGRCDPGIDDIARNTGFCGRSVRRAIGQLQGLGLLTREIHGGRRHANAYRLDWDALVAMTAGAMQQRKADSAGTNRTPGTGEADSGVRQNRVRKHLSTVVGEAPRARPDPAQPQFMLPISGGRMADVAHSSAQARVSLALTAHLARFGPRFAAKTRAEISTDVWAAAIQIERDAPGKGLEHLLEALLPRPPPAVAVG